MESNENSIQEMEREEQEIENINEKTKLREVNIIEYYNGSVGEINTENKLIKIILFIFITIFILLIVYNISIKITDVFYERKIKLNKQEKNNYKNNNNQVEQREGNINVLNNTKNLNDSLKETGINNDKKMNFTNTNNIHNKIGLAFVYTQLYSNEIAKLIALTANHFMGTGKYDICFITSEPDSKDYSFNSSIKRFIAFNNHSLIRNITKNENIDIFILQDVLSLTEINFYKSLGKKVIGLFHGAFLSSLSHGSVSEYRNIINFDLFDSFIFLTPDDYYFYKNLGFKNEIYIPNLYTFEPNKTLNSNLTYNNIIMLGGENDTIKEAKYALKTMNLIIKEVHDAVLTLITSDGNIQFLMDLVKELNLTNNKFISNHTYNISSYFLNSSIYMFTSITDAFPISMNEGKAHGLPIIAFDVPYSPSYQDGVITVDQLDCEALAREIVYLLKDYNYRKRIGEYAKRSLNKYSNKETLDLWETLFKSILSYDKNEYRELQDFIEKNYYDVERARWNLQKHFDTLLRNNENLKCHSLDNFTDINYVKNIQDCKK